MKSELADRTLWYDGTIEVDPQTVEQLLMLGVSPSDIAVTEVDDEITRFNQLANCNIQEKHALKPLDFGWRIPQEYLAFDVDDYIAVLRQSIPANDVDYDRRITRLDNELAEFKRRNLIFLLRTIVYVTDTLRAKRILWGVGRGSSCASYILYLVGLHCVDPVKYNIPMNEFLHD
jgi:DNA polymerase III alpha subunit